MKLVTSAAKKLGAEGGEWLKKLVDAAQAKDADYFRTMTVLRDLLAGNHWKNIRNRKKREQVEMVVNLCHAHVRTLVPTLFFQNPSVDCAPTAPIHVGKETTWNGILNNTLDKIGFAEELKRAVLDAVVYQEGVVKDVVNRVDTPNSEVNSSGPSVWLSRGAPVHVRISPAQLLVDYLVTDRNVDDARFIAIRYKKPLQELKKHPIYGKNIERDYKVADKTPTTGNLVGANINDFEDWEDIETKTYGDTGEELVCIYEVWIHQLISTDGKTELYRQMCVLMEGQQKPIRELESWDSVMGEGFDRFPVTRLVLNPIPDKLPSSELGIWQQLQVALNWLMSRITQLVENDRLLYAVDPSKIKNFEKFKNKFYKGDSRELVEVTDMNNPIAVIQPTFVGRDNYSLVNMLQQYIQQVSGIGQNRRGGSGIRTATEASLVDEGTRIKTDEKVDSVATFIKTILGKTALMIRGITKREGSNSWVMRVGGDVGAVDWVNFTAEDIAWTPEIRIRVNSFRKQDSMQDMQKFSALIQQAMQLMSVYGPSVRVDLLFGRMLEAAGVYDYDKIIGSQDKEALLQTIELAGIITGVPTPVLESHNHPAHVQIIDAFVQSTMGQQIINSAPEVMDRLMQHREEHLAMLEAIQQKAQITQATAQNPFSTAGSGSGSPQSAANQQTSGDRTAVQSIPGGNGEFA